MHHCWQSSATRAGFYARIFGRRTAGQALGGGFHAASVSPLLRNNLTSGNQKHVVMRNTVGGPVVSTTDTASDGSGSVTSLGHNLFTADANITGLVSSDLRNVAAPLGILRDNGGTDADARAACGQPGDQRGRQCGRAGHGSARSFTTARRECRYRCVRIFRARHPLRWRGSVGDFRDSGNACHR